jgi:hypothetical protein
MFEEGMFGREGGRKGGKRKDGREGGREGKEIRSENAI